jgi:oligosaccharide repeat unit polymerase
VTLFIVIWSIVVTSASILLIRIFGRTGLSFILSYFIVFLIAPVSSFLLYRNFTYDLTVPVIVVALFSLVAGVMFTARFISRAEFCPKEASVSINLTVILFLSIILVLVLYGNFKIYQLIFSLYQVANLNDLNIAFSDPNLPSLGIYGRLSRLAIPAGLICFAAMVTTDSRHSKKYLGVFCLLFTASLIGVRRSIFIYQIIFYAITYLSTIRNVKQLFKSLLPLALVSFMIVSVFGYVQVNTNKSKQDSAVLSGLSDGLVYFSGNITYAECISRDIVGLQKGNSLPIYFIVTNRGKVGFDGVKKSFCEIYPGQLFNTSPAYFDFYNDFGYVGEVVFMLVMAFIATLFILGRISLLGLGSIFVSALLLMFRENIIGQLDILYSIVIYPILLSIIIRLSKGRKMRVSTV